MAYTHRSHIFVGMTAVAGAIGAAAMLSVATAPTARADDFTDVIADVQADLGYGGTAFSNALTDFAGNAPVEGFANLFAASDNDLLSAPNNLIADSVAVLANESVYGPVDIQLFVPTDFSDAVGYAQQFMTDGLDDLSDGATFLSAGEYGEAFIFDLFGADYATIIPLEEILLGSVASL
jgi:hypothetical protein